MNVSVACVLAAGAGLLWGLILVVMSSWYWNYPPDICGESKRAYLQTIWGCVAALLILAWICSGVAVLASFAAALSIGAGLAHHRLVHSRVRHVA